MDKVTTMIVSPTYGRFIFDAVFSTDHSANATVTQHPVQSGASISDHAYMEPDEVSVEIGMTDTAASVSGGASHSVNAYTQLRAIMELREPFTLITRLKTYRNMLITSISAPDDYRTMNALRASIVFQQVNVVSVSTVTVQEMVTSSKTTTNKASSSKTSSSSTSKSGSSSAKTASTTKTTKSTSGASSSVLKKLSKALGF